jgi:hypothetical protein
VAVDGSRLLTVRSIQDVTAMTSEEDPIEALWVYHMISRTKPSNDIACRGSRGERSLRRCPRSPCSTRASCS